MAKLTAMTPTTSRAEDMIMSFAAPECRDMPEARLFACVIGRALEDLYGLPYAPQNGQKRDLQRYEEAENRDDAYWWFVGGQWKVWAEYIGVAEELVEHWWQTVWARRLSKDAQGGAAQGGDGVVQRGRRRPPLRAPVGFQRGTHSDDCARPWDTAFAAYYGDATEPEPAAAD